MQNQNNEIGKLNPYLNENFPMGFLTPERILFYFEIFKEIEF
jgi:hypothetical protein